MATFYVSDANTGELTKIEVGSPSGKLNLLDYKTGDTIEVDLSNPTGIINLIDADTGEIVETDLANPVGTFHVIDDDTGEIIEIDLSNPSGNISIHDSQTGDNVQINMDTGFFPVGDSIFLKHITIVQYEEPSYDNDGGTGDRTEDIIVTPPEDIVGDSTVLVDGIKTGQDFYFLDGTPVLGKNLKFDFLTKRLIKEAKIYWKKSQGIWQWQGSNDGIVWTNIGESFTLGGGDPQTTTALQENTVAYRYYKLVGVSGEADGTSGQEIEFLIANSVTLGYGTTVWGTGQWGN